MRRSAVRNVALEALLAHPMDFIVPLRADDRVFEIRAGRKET